MLAGALGGTLGAQMHKVEAPQTVVRAVGVYEWIGDMAKPSASRLIPVTLYIDNQLEDAGLYLARPVPFALENGNLYELDQAGVPKGNLEVEFARHLQARNIAEAYDDGWTGYGRFESLAPPKKPGHRLPPARTAGIQTAGNNVLLDDPDRPHFVNRQGKPVTAGQTGNPSNTADAGKKDDSTQQASADPDRPHFSRKDGGSSGNSSDSSSPANDPDRPTFKRPHTSDSGTDTASNNGGLNNPADDPDRPTLKRRKAPPKKSSSDDEASVSGVGNLNNDPDRPHLERGRPAHPLTLADFPKLTGMPVSVHQMIAVSDATNRPEHDFSRPWENDAERTAILGKMQEMARAQIAAYDKSRAPVATTTAPATQPKRANSKLRRPIKPLQAAATTPVPLLDEQLKGYLLSYGDVPTFVYQAHTDGAGASQRFVTVVAQMNMQGEPVMVLHSVTDAAHLDVIPQLRLVDAVDVDASNRASLLFEMRGQDSRQFGVYRVLGLQAQQIFSTGTTQ